MKINLIRKKLFWNLLWIIPVVLIYLTFSDLEDCQAMVIDTYEIHSNIDIPAVLPLNCYYDEEIDVRISVYILEGTLNLNRFKTMDRYETIGLLSGRNLLNENEIPKSDKLSVATGDKWGRTWTYVFEAKTRRLWAELKY